MKYIPQIEPWIDDGEMIELAEVIKSTYITENKKTDEFLEGIKNLTSSNQAIAVSNGTVALVAALLGAGIGPGDKVVVPDLTFIASSNAVRLVGATPILCDVDVTTGCLDVAAFEGLIDSTVRAVMPVHLYGQMVEMEQLMEVAAQHSIEVIEDAAEALGVTYHGRHAGTFGRFGTFSFFANKTITCGEGGVILSQTAEDNALLFRIKNHGRDRKGIFIHDSVGYNFCFTDLQAAVGVSQLKKFKKIMAGKRRVFDRYVRNLNGKSGIEVVVPPAHVESNYWFINVLVDDPSNLEESLTASQIGSRRYFYPLHLQPCNSDLKTTKRFPNSSWLYQHGLSLPSGPLLTDDEIDRVCDVVISCV